MRRFKGMNIIKKQEAKDIIQKSLFECLTLYSPIFLANSLCESVFLGAFISKKEQRGARKKIVKRKATITPKKMPFPTVLMGSIGARFNDKKPMAVVIDVRNKGCKFSFKL